MLYKLMTPLMCLSAASTMKIEEARTNLEQHLSTLNTTPNIPALLGLNSSIPKHTQIKMASCIWCIILVE